MVSLSRSALPLRYSKNHRPPCLIFTLFYSPSLIGSFYPSSYLLLPSFYPKAYHYGRWKK